MTTTASRIDDERARRSPRRVAGIAAAVCVGALAATGAVAQTEPRVDDAGVGRTAGALDAARQAYEDGRWEAAYRQLAALADDGDAEAARIAWLMHRHGLPLYRTVLPASDAQRLRWQHLSAKVTPLPFRSMSTWAFQPVVDVDPSRIPAAAGIDPTRRQP